MSIPTIELLFDLGCLPKAYGPRGHIAVNCSSNVGERTVLSAECRTVEEVESAVKVIKADLNKVLADARRAFA